MYLHAALWCETFGQGGGGLGSSSRFGCDLGSVIFPLRGLVPLSQIEASSYLPLSWHSDLFVFVFLCSPLVRLSPACHSRSQLRNWHLLLFVLFKEPLRSLNVRGHLGNSSAGDRRDVLMQRCWPGLALVFFPCGWWPHRTVTP